MARDEILVSPDEVPEEARQHMAAVLAEQEHPLVQSHFHQVTWLSLPLPDHRPVDFFALEFRSGMCAALIWQDDQGNWGAGKWLLLPHADADVTCGSGLSLHYCLAALTVTLRKKMREWLKEGTGRDGKGSRQRGPYTRMRYRHPASGDRHSVRLPCRAADDLLIDYRSHEDFRGACPSPR